MSNTIESIEQGNRLIADFMNWQHHEDREYDAHEMANLKYHTSWDWLMPVINKIKDTLNNWPTRPSKNHCNKGDFIEVDIQCHLWEINIEGVWEYTVKFIEWYNNQKSNL